MKWLIALAVFAAGLWAGYAWWGLVGALVALAICVVLGALFRLVLWIVAIGAVLSDGEPDRR